MKTIHISIVLLLTIMLCNSNADTLPNIYWERTYNDKYYAVDAASISAKTNELVLVGEIDSLATGSLQNNGIWIWKIGSDGNKVADLVLKEVPLQVPIYRKTVSNPRRVISMLVNTDDTIWLVTESDFPSILLLKTNFNGDILISKQMPGGRSISKILPLSEGFLAFGHINGKAAFMKVDGAGKEVWKKTSEHTAYGMFYDGIPTKDGGFILVENSDATNNYALDGRTIYLARYDANGEKIFEKTFAGRLGKLVAGPNDTFALLYDRNAFEGLGYWINQYDLALNLKWGLNVATHKYGIDNFVLSIVGNINYTLVGESFGNFKTYIAYVDAAGTKKGEYFGGTFIYGTNLVCFDVYCYLVELISNDVDLNSNDIKQVKVTKFQPSTVFNNPLKNK